MPSSALLGLTTDSGWTVTEEIRTTLGSGGNFCCRYLAESQDGKHGFLKAMDVNEAIGDINKLQNLINQYVFEKDILFYCRDKKMTRVVTPLDAGEIVVPNFSPPLNNVYYVIFEQADGDLRQNFVEVNNFSWLAAFKVLHHVAIGAFQLHRAGIAHQDIKPSNILCFNSIGSKISDLGRVTDKKGFSPFSKSIFSGDRAYAPVEWYFGIGISEFSDRFYSDIHMVGSLVFHLVTNVQISAIIMEESKALVPDIRSMKYADALPFLMSAFNTILVRFEKECANRFGEKISLQMSNIVFEMCHPDRLKRGSPKFTNKVARISMNRYVGKFANLVFSAIVEGIN